MCSHTMQTRNDIVHGTHTTKHAFYCKQLLTRHGNKLI